MSNKSIEVHFPGGKCVDAKIGEFHLRTDQSVKEGGQASAPEPFDLFLASIATCAGIFAVNFCESRGIDTGGMDLRMEWDWDRKKRLINCMRLILSLPEGFPEKYRGGIVKAMGLCTVKRHMLEAPEFDIQLGILG